MICKRCGARMSNAGNITSRRLGGKFGRSKLWVCPNCLFEIEEKIW